MNFINRWVDPYPDIPAEGSELLPLLDDGVEETDTKHYLAPVHAQDLKNIKSTRILLINNYNIKNLNNSGKLSLIIKDIIMVPIMKTLEEIIMVPIMIKNVF